MRLEESKARQMLIHKWSKLSAESEKIKVNQRIINRVASSVKELTHSEVLELLLPSPKPF